MTWIGWLVGCSTVTLDFEATCAREWPDDECDGDCAQTELEDRWLAAFEPAFAEATGLAEGDVAGYARVRSLTGSMASTFQSISSASYQVDIGWVRVVRELELWTEGPTATDDELVDGWATVLAAPALDLDPTLMSYEEAQAAVDDCAAELGVTFDAVGWCSPWYPTDWDDDDSGLRFDFFADAGGDYAFTSVDVLSDETRCEANQGGTD